MTTCLKAPAVSTLTSAAELDARAGMHSAAATQRARKICEFMGLVPAIIANVRDPVSFEAANLAARIRRVSNRDKTEFSLSICLF
jgi:hypothetical protein